MVLGSIPKEGILFTNTPPKTSCSMRQATTKRTSRRRVASHARYLQIYVDDFNGSAHSDLNETPPDVADIIIEPDTG